MRVPRLLATGLAVGLMTLTACTATQPVETPDRPPSSSDPGPTVTTPREPTPDATTATTDGLRPEVQPDGTTLFLTRGSLPAGSAGTTTVDRTGELSVQLSCQGVGTLEFHVDPVTPTGRTLPSPGTLTCSEDPGGATADVDLGTVDAGTELTLSATGTDWIRYLVVLTLGGPTG